MLKTEQIILMNVSIAAEQTLALPGDKAMKKYLQHCIHVSRQVLRGKLDVAIFEKFFAIRFPEERIDGDDADTWLTRFAKGIEWQKGDYQTRRALQEAAPDVYPTDLDKFFNRLDAPEVKKS